MIEYSYQIEPRSADLGGGVAGIERREWTRHTRRNSPY